MLRNVLNDYLDRLRKESDFYVLFAALLASNGYKDIFLTHGPNEIGRDFIAKLDESERLVQYCFQIKKGSIGLSEWRKDVQVQLWEAATIGVPHPAYDHRLPTQAVLVLTGELGPAVRVALDSLNRSLKENGRAEVAVWNRSRLLTELQRVQPDVIYSNTATGYSAYGDFFVLYGRCLSGLVEEAEIERHSRYWIDGSSTAADRMFVAAMESASISSACRTSGKAFASLHSHLALWRGTLITAFADPLSQYIDELVRSEGSAVFFAAKEYVDEILKLLEQQGVSLASLFGPSGMLLYRIVCCNVLVALTIQYFLTTNPQVRGNVVKQLRKLILTEPGCAQPISDRYAVPVALAALALHDAQDYQTSKQFLREYAKWTFARYASGVGIGGIEDSEDAAARRILNLDDANQSNRMESFAATVVADTAAHLRYSDLYADIVNDIVANDMIPQYYQAFDDEGQLSVHSPKVLRFSHIEFAPTIGTELDNYGSHMSTEPRSFRLLERYGRAAYVGLSLLLRDRYFVTTWNGPDPISYDEYA